MALSQRDDFREVGHILQINRNFDYLRQTGTCLTQYLVQVAENLFCLCVKISYANQVSRRVYGSLSRGEYQIADLICLGDVKRFQWVGAGFDLKSFHHYSD